MQRFQKAGGNERGNWRVSCGRWNEDRAAELKVISSSTEHGEIHQRERGAAAGTSNIYAANEA